jgi:hypothetical protein
MSSAAEQRQFQVPGSKFQVENGNPAPSAGSGQALSEAERGKRAVHLELETWNLELATARTLR